MHLQSAIKNNHQHFFTSQSLPVQYILEDFSESFARFFFVAMLFYINVSRFLEQVAVTSSWTYEVIQSNGNS